MQFPRVPSFVLLVPLMLAAPGTVAEPWLCTDADGQKSFSYDPAAARERNCVHHPIPSPNHVRAAPPAKPRTLKPGAARASGATASGFPRVDARIQKARDAERRQILERELAREKQSLQTAIEALAERKRLLFAAERDDARTQAVLKPYADRIRLHLTNIESLEKELGRGG